ncbi:MAG: site-2 protease family protein [Ignavibacteria bacterium]
MEDYYQIEEEKQKSKTSFLARRYSFLINILLFIVTFFTTTIAGVAWIGGPVAAFNLDNFHLGLPYSISILFVLGVHEFGHYFAAKYHKVKATLPFFIPFPVTDLFLNFGTLGAVIKTKSVVPDKKSMFDIGVAGPIASFFASVGILIYGFTHLPGVEYILKIHPDYFSPEKSPDVLELQFGYNLIYLVLEKLFTNPEVDFIPPMTEIYHYPFLCVGWFGLFVTAMNLIPVGQLDGGHISYSLFSTKTHQRIADLSFVFLIVLGIAGFISEIYLVKIPFGWTGWLFWALILRFFVRLYHPEVPNLEELDPRRKMIGYFSIFIFIVSFIPVPFYIKLS